VRPLLSKPASGKRGSPYEDPDPEDLGNNKSDQPVNSTKDPGVGSLPRDKLSLTIRGNLIDSSPNAIPSSHNCVLKSKAQREEFAKLRKNGTLIPTTDTRAWLKAIFIDKPGKPGARFIINGKEAEGRGLSMIKASHTVSASRAIHAAGQAAARSRWIGTIDLEAGYYNCKLRESEIYTTVRIEGRVWRMTAPAQGLSSAPKRCCEIFDAAFAVTGAESSYFDNAIYVGTTEEECRLKVLRACKTLTEMGFRINRKETIVSALEVKFLGIMISENGIRASSKDLQKLKLKKSEQGMTSYLDHIFPFGRINNQWKHKFDVPIKIYTDGCKGKFAASTMKYHNLAVHKQKACVQANQQQSERLAYHQGAKRAYHYHLNEVYTDAASLMLTPHTSGFRSAHQALVKFIEEGLQVQAKYINTALNPADFASRNLLPVNQKETQLETENLDIISKSQRDTNIIHIKNIQS